MTLESLRRFDRCSGINKGLVGFHGESSDQPLAENAVAAIVGV